MEGLLRLLSFKQKDSPIMTSWMDGVKDSGSISGQALEASVSADDGMEKQDGVLVKVLVNTNCRLVIMLIY